MLHRGSTLLGLGQWHATPRRVRRMLPPRRLRCVQFASPGSTVSGWMTYALALACVPSPLRQADKVSTAGWVLCLVCALVARAHSGNRCGGLPKMGVVPLQWSPSAPGIGASA